MAKEQTPAWTDEKELEFQVGDMHGEATEEKTKREQHDFLAQEALNTWMEIIKKTKVIEEGQRHDRKIVKDFEIEEEQQAQANVKKP